MIFPPLDAPRSPSVDLSWSSEVPELPRHHRSASQDRFSSERWLAPVDAPRARPHWGSIAGTILNKAVAAVGFGALGLGLLTAGSADAAPVVLPPIAAVQLVDSSFPTVRPASLSAEAREIFQKAHQNEASPLKTYYHGMCHRNVLRLAQVLEDGGVDVGEAKVIVIYRPGAESRDTWFINGSRVGHPDKVEYHVVLELDGYVLDEDFGVEATPLPTTAYLTQVLGEQNADGEMRFKSIELDTYFKNFSGHAQNFLNNHGEYPPLTLDQLLAR